MNACLHRIKGWGLALVLLFCPAWVGAALEDRATLEAFVDGLVIPLMRNHSSPSGTVAIAHRGELILAKGYGYQDIAQRSPVDPYRTLFRPGSTSKLFTWVAVMQLVEQGRLDLDTDVNQYLRSVQIREAFDQPITLRHILTHTAGFEDGAFGYLIIEDPAKALPLAEAMARYQPDRVNPPGAQTAYSNYATALAGLIVAEVSGQSFEEYTQRHIFDPLGMRHATFVEPLPEHLAPDMAGSYAVEAGAFVSRPFEIVASFGPAGGMSATATDLVRFGEAIRLGGTLEGAQILRSETTEQMLTQAFSHDARLMGMALGFYATDYNGFRVMGHGGDTQWFHSYLGIDAANELTFFVSFGGQGGSTVRTAFAPALYDRFFPRSDEPPVPPDDFAQRAARYAGHYAPWRGSFSKIEKASGLSGGFAVSPGPDNTLVLTMAGNAKAYAEIEPNLFRELDPGIAIFGGLAPRLLAFQESPDGAINGFVLDGLPFLSTRKLSGYETPGFNLSLIGLAMLIFAAVVLRRIYQRRELHAWPAADRKAFRAAFWVALLHLATLLLGLIVISMAAQKIFSGIPLSLKLWLWLPIACAIASVFLAYVGVQVWRTQRFSGVLARLRFSFIVFAALAMTWFYYFWNLLGFNYFA